jgi:hypothetical protein
VRVTLDTEYPFGETLKFSVLAEVSAGRGFHSTKTWRSNI